MLDADCNQLDTFHNGDVTSTPLSYIVDTDNEEGGGWLQLPYGDQNFGYLPIDNIYIVPDPEAELPFDTAEINSWGACATASLVTAGAEGCVWVNNARQLATTASFGGSIGIGEIVGIRGSVAWSSADDLSELEGWSVCLTVAGATYGAGGHFAVCHGVEVSLNPFNGVWTIYVGAVFPGFGAEVSVSAEVADVDLVVDQVRADRLIRAICEDNELYPDKRDRLADRCPRRERTFGAPLSASPGPIPLCGWVVLPPCWCRSALTH